MAVGLKRSIFLTILINSILDKLVGSYVSNENLQKKKEITLTTNIRKKNVLPLL